MISQFSKLYLDNWSKSIEKINMIKRFSVFSIQFSVIFQVFTRWNPPIFCNFPTFYRGLLTIIFTCERAENSSTYTVEPPDYNGGLRSRLRQAGDEKLQVEVWSCRWCPACRTWCCALTATFQTNIEMSP